MSRETITANTLAPTVGPFSHAVREGGFIFRARKHYPGTSYVPVVKSCFEGFRAPANGASGTRPTLGTFGRLVTG